MVWVNLWLVVGLVGEENLDKPQSSRWLGRGGREGAFGGQLGMPPVPVCRCSLFQFADDFLGRAGMLAVPVGMKKKY